MIYDLLKGVLMKEEDNDKSLSVIRHTIWIVIFQIKRFLFVEQGIVVLNCYDFEGSGGTTLRHRMNK